MGSLTYEVRDNLSQFAITNYMALSRWRKNYLL